MFYKRPIKDYTVGDDHRILFEMKFITPHTKVWAEKKGHVLIVVLRSHTQDAQVAE